MSTGILSEFPVIDGSYAGHSAQHSKEHADFSRKTRASGVIPNTRNTRMQLLHFENAFGDVRVSEYCMDAMLSLVLLMGRNSRADADRLARLTGTANTAYPPEDSLVPDAEADCEAASVRRVG